MRFFSNTEYSMIIGKLGHSSRIESLHPQLGKLFQFVKQHQFSPQEIGKIILDEENLFINHELLEGHHKEQQPLEIHRTYMDVHILLEGEETIGWKATEDLQQETEPYSEEKDCAFYADTPTSFITLQPGEFAIAFPEDAHAPAIGNGKIHKLIAKLKI